MLDPTDKPVTLHLPTGTKAHVGFPRLPNVGEEIVVEIGMMTAVEKQKPTRYRDRKIWFSVNLEIGRRPEELTQSYSRANADLEVAE